MDIDLHCYSHQQMIQRRKITEIKNAYIWAYYMHVFGYLVNKVWVVMMRIKKTKQ
jgi:hypothetical protein